MAEPKGVIFLGGTCNDDPWREVVMENLDNAQVPYFNPVVKDWNEEAQKKEDEFKANKDNIQLFVITNKMTGVFSIAEVVHAAHTNPLKTVLGVCKDGFSESQIKSLYAVTKLVMGITGYGVSYNVRPEVLRDVAYMATELWKRSS